MNIDHLRPDELAVELSVRELPTAGRSGVERLRTMLAAENQDPTSKPTILQHGSVVTEGTELCAKIQELRSEIMRAVQSADESLYDELRSRLFHVASRSERLFEHGGTDLRNTVVSIGKDLSQLREMGSPRPTNELQNRRELEMLGTASGSGEPGATSRGQQGTRETIESFRAQIDALMEVVNQLRVNNAASVPPNPPRGPTIPVVESGSRASFSYRPFNNSHFLSKWTIRFSGDPKGLSVDEFLFRVEALAAANNVTTASLVLGLHYLLEGRAESWYWLELRKRPAASWDEFSRAIRGQFGTYVSDCDLMRELYSRVQRPNEKFADFRLAMETLAARLARPMMGGELVDILRHNMSRRLQSALLLCRTDSADELTRYCTQFEDLWYRPADTMLNNRPTRNFDVHELEEELGESGSVRIVQPSLEPLQADLPRGNSSAGNYLICWNCKDIGHGFQECESATRNIFCYGCGKPEAYKPSCPKCNPGNRRTNAAGPATQRSRPNPFRRS